MSGTFPFCAKKSWNKSQTKWARTPLIAGIMWIDNHSEISMFCFTVQRAFRTRRVNVHFKNVTRRRWWRSATFTVASFSKMKCHLSAQKTGVYCKMLSGMNKNSNKPLGFYSIFWWWLKFHLKFSESKRRKESTKLFCRRHDLNIIFRMNFYTTVLSVC